MPNRREYRPSNVLPDMMQHASLERRGRRRTGEPLWVLALIVIAWTAFRVTVWEPPVLATLQPRGGAPVTFAPLRQAPIAFSSQVAIVPDGAGVETGSKRWKTLTDRSSVRAAVLDHGLHAPASEAAFPQLFDPIPATASVQSLAENRGDWPLAPPGLSREREARPSRWSADAWAVLREGGRALGSAAGSATLGGSQAGAVVRYRLTAPEQGGIALYGRVSHALATSGETEAAAGVQTKPFAALPVALHLEARVTRREDGTELRPAAFATTGFDEAALPAGVKARGYAQAGYVGGDFATAFVDGQVIAEKSVARLDLGASEPARLHIGAGVWAGAQDGASRLDVGPQVSLTVPLAQGRARLSAEYRLRVAGNAEPADGFALTLSAGF